MDQLKILLEHKFWVLTAVTLLLPPIGWWMSTGDLAAETEKRKGELKNSISTATNLARDAASYPNKAWIAGAKKVGEELNHEIDQSHERLFERQKGAMVWPELVQRQLDAAKVKYRGDGSNNFSAFLDAKRFFAADYEDDWRQVVNIIEPFNMTTGDGKVLLGEGIDVSLAGSIIAKAPAEQWRATQSFSAAQMWDAQEDIWLLRALMQAIARVNRGATKIDDTPIKRLISLELRGGNPTDLKERRDGKQKEGAAAATQAPQRKLSFTGFSTGSDAEGRPLGQAFEPKEFLADDVFGADSSAPVGTTNEKDARKGIGIAEPLRYVEQQSGKWRKRGFVLKLVMDQREIPTLITEISASVFPAEIWHLEHKDYDATQGIRQSGAYATPTAAFQNPVAGGGTPQDQEQQQQQERIRSRVESALNQSYLAEVILAGTFTIFDEPGGSGNAAAATAGAGTATAPLTSTTAKPAAPSTPAPKPAGTAAASNAAGTVSPAGTKTATAVGQPTPVAAPSSAKPGSATPPVPATGAATAASKGGARAAEAIAPSGGAPKGNPSAPPAAKK